MAAMDLGLGSDLAQQEKDMTEEEKRKRRLGMSMMQSPAAQMLLGPVGPPQGMRGRGAGA